MNTGGSHLDDPGPNEVERMLSRIIEFAERHVSSPEDLARARADPNAVRAVNRYHGERYDLPQRMMPEATRGRGECFACGHAVYFDDRPRIERDMPPRSRLMCLRCLLQHADPSEPLPVALSCPSWCPWLRARPS